MRNSRIAAIFQEIADVLELQGGNPFRIRSYRQGARTVADLAEPLADYVEAGKDPSDLPGIGESLAEQIHEILETDTCARLENLRGGFPPHLRDLLKVKGLGPKKVKALHDALGIATIPDLRAAAEAGRIRDLPGMGAKTEANILRALKTHQAEAGRISIRTAAEQVEDLGRHLDGVTAVCRWVPAGSFRRRRETIGDLDVLVEADDRAAAVEGIEAYAAVEEVEARGEEKVVARLAGELEVDFRFFRDEAFGAAQMYFTGSKAHNIALRKIARKRGWKLNEYGLFDENERRLAGADEAEVYAALDLPWVPPELREDRGELGAAREGRLPALIEEGDLRGELHAHTHETDGHQSLEEMVEGARKRGYEYLAVTDHSQAVTVAKGLDADRLAAHRDRIRELAEKTDDLRLLAGIEVDILKDGSLDLPEKVLEGLDWVVASVHSFFELAEAAMTDRFVAAAASGVVHCLGHPRGRIIGRREPVALDLGRVFEACAEHDVAVEINAHPDRLDLPDVDARRAKEAGLKVVIATDAHTTIDYDLVRYGVWNARRGWIEKSDVLNTLSAKALAKHLGLDPP